MQNLVQVKKSAFSDPYYIGKLLKSNLDCILDGSSDGMLLVYVKTSLNFEEL